MSSRASHQTTDRILPPYIQLKTDIGIKYKTFLACICFFFLFIRSICFMSGKLCLTNGNNPVVKKHSKYPKEIRSSRLERDISRKAFLLENAKLP